MCCQCQCCMGASPAATPTGYKPILCTSSPALWFTHTYPLTQVHLLLPSTAALARNNTVLVELPPCFDVDGDAGAIGRVLVGAPSCSTLAGQRRGTVMPGSNAAGTGSITERVGHCQCGTNSGGAVAACTLDLKGNFQSMSWGPRPPPPFHRHSRPHDTLTTHTPAPACPHPRHVLRD